MQSLFSQEELAFLGDRLAQYSGLFTHLNYPVADPDFYKAELQPIFKALMEQYDEETIQQRRAFERGRREQEYLETIGFQWQEDIDFWLEQERKKREREEEEARRRPPPPPGPPPGVLPPPPPGPPPGGRPPPRPSKAPPERNPWADASDPSDEEAVQWY